MMFTDFRSAFMPYCLRRQEDGRYAVLNREYKPVGMLVNEFVKYEDHPVLVHIDGIDSETSAKLSCKGKPDTNDIFLYEGTISDEKSMNDYLYRLSILARLRISNGR